jgi:hypothetical protein
MILPASLSRAGHLAAVEAAGPEVLAVKDVPTTMDA